MAMSERLRDSNQLAQATYRAERRKQLGSDALATSTDISDYRSPGLVDPETVQDNTIVLLVEAGTCVNLDIEHPDQPPSTHYTTDASEKIGIRYLEVADDSIEVCRVEANNGILNAYERDSELGSGPKTAREVFPCASLGGTWNPIKQVWEIDNVEIRLFGRIPPATIRRMLSYYTIRPAHSYGFFTKLNMNDWDDYSDLEDNQINAPTFPTTRYAPVREIVVHGSKMTHINLNTMQYLYYAYIGGYTKARMIKIAYCPVLKAIGSVGIWGKRDNTTSTAFGTGSYRNCKSLKSAPGIGYSAPVQRAENMYKECSALTSTPWTDTSKSNTFSYMYYNTAISSLPPYDYRYGANFIYFCANCTSLTGDIYMNTPSAIDMYNAFLRTSIGILEIVASGKLRIISSILADVRTVTEFNLSISGESGITDISFFLSGCNKLTKLKLFDTSNVTSANAAFQETLSLVSLDSFNFSAVQRADYIFARSGISMFQGALHFVAATSLESAFSESKFNHLAILTTTALLTNAKYIFRGSALAGVFDNLPGDNGAPNASVVTSGITNATGMFRQTKITLLEIDLSAATNVDELCYGCASLVSASIKLTDGVITDISNMFEDCSALGNDHLDCTTYGSAVVDASYAWKNINWGATPDNTGYVILRFPAATNITGCIHGCHGRQYIKLHNVSKLPNNTSNRSPFWNSSLGTYSFNQFPARKLWILNATCQKVFDSWRELVTKPSVAAATFEITLESVTEFNPAWLNNMVRLTKVTFINEPLDFQATAGLWIAANNFQTNPLLTEISLQGQVTPEFVKAVQVVAPTTVNYTGSITILHHNDLAWT